MCGEGWGRMSAHGPPRRHFPALYFFLPVFGRGFAFWSFLTRCGNFVAGRRVDCLGLRDM